MLSLFKRKRCKQCGEELKMFKRVDFCDLDCYYFYKDNREQYEMAKEAVESKKSQTK